MCGLVGAMVAGNHTTLSKWELEQFRDLLYCSALRGGDSTGVMWWDGKDIRMYKTNQHPADFVYDDAFQRLINSQGIKAVFGHTRLATKGKITAKNAHPFKVKDDIWLMHNGMVSSVKGTKVEEFEVDSMALAESIHKHTPSEVFETFTGAVACIWFDARNQTINFYRNSQRPFWMTDNSITNYFASEKAMLSWVMERKGNINYQYKELVDNHHLSISLDKIDMKSKPSKIERKYPTYSGYRGSWVGDEFGDYDVDCNYPLVTRTAADFRRNQGIHYDRPPLSERTTGHVITLPHIKPKANTDQDVKISQAALKDTPYFYVKKDGPFEINKTINILAYGKESYTIITGGDKEEVKYKLFATTLFIGPDSVYDIPKYQLVPLEAFGFTSEEQVDQLIQESFLEADVVNIRFNREYSNLEDRCTVFVTRVKPATVAKSA